MYCESNSEAYNIRFNNCKFVNTGAKANKAAVNIKETSSKGLLKYNVELINCTTEGLFPAVGQNDTAIVYDPAVQIDDFSTTGETQLTLKIDGELVYPVAK